MRLYALHACAAAALLAVCAASAQADGEACSADLGPPPATTEAEVATPPEGAAVARGNPRELPSAVPASLVAWAPADEPLPSEDAPPVTPPAPAPADFGPAPADTAGRLVRYAPTTVYEPWYRFRPRHPWRITLEGSTALIEGPSGRLGEPLPAGTAGFDWGRVELDPAYGGRASVVHAFTPWDRVEVRGAWWSATQGSSRQTGVFGFAPPAGGVSLPASATFETEDKLLSAEATWWWTLARRRALRWSAGAGARYVRFEETSQVTDWTAPLGFGPPALRSQAENDFLAAQVAGSVRWQANRRLAIGLTAKGMLGVLKRDVAIQDSSLLAGGTHRTGREGRDLGWGADVELSTTWRLNRSVGLTAGYSLLYLGEVARAHEAMDLSRANTGAVQTRRATGSLVTHQFFVGFEVRL